MKKKNLCSIIALLMTVMVLLAQVPALAFEGTDDSIAGNAPPSTRNVAGGAEVTISDCTANKKGEENSYQMPGELWDKRFLIDGNTDFGWSTNPYDQETDKTAPVTITIKLKNPAEVSAVGVFPKGTSAVFPTSYKVKVSADGKRYTEVADSKKNVKSPTAPNIHRFAAVTVQYVQIHVYERYAVESAGAGQASDGLLVQLGEIAVYAVSDEPPVEKVPTLRISKCALELLRGTSDTLTATAINAEKAALVTWGSDNPAVATVDSDGVVTAKAVGKATITATDSANNLSDKCEVVVVKERPTPFDDNIMISIFWPPTKDYINDEQYKLIADANITYVMGANDLLDDKETQMEMLRLCNKYGLQMTVGDSRLGNNVLNASADTIKSIVDEYKNIPSVGGYYILDEPYNPNLYIGGYKNLKDADPDRYMHLNFLPSAAYPSMETYKSQLDDWCKLCEASGYTLDYLMYDRYPFGVAAGSMDREGFLSNMQVVRQVGLDNNVKTGAYIQTVELINGFRRPEDSAIRYEVYMYLAYGYKQISYFTWFTPVNRSEPFNDGIISPHGVPNAHYETVKMVDAEVLALGKTLINCDAVEVYLNGNTWGQKKIPGDFPVQATDNTGFTVSLLRDKNTGRNYIMVVNNDFLKEKTFSLKLDSSITSIQKVSKVNGSLENFAINDNQITLTLAAGDGELFALPENVDFTMHDKINTVSKDNIALDAQIICDSSCGTNDKYMNNLNDGIKAAAADGTQGWASDGNSASKIVVAFPGVREFTRVDIYPAGSRVTLGRNFASDIKVSVSDDKVHWRQVAGISGYKIESMSVPSLTFAAVKAQYIMLEFSGYYEEYLALAEIEVYDDPDGKIPAPLAFAEDEEPVEYTEGMNLALNKPYEVSSDTSEVYRQWNWGALYINDGDLDTGWTSDVKLHRNPDATEYVIIDFCDIFNVDKVVVYPKGAKCWPVDFRIQLSENGIAWIDIANETDSKAPDENYTVNLDAPVKARFVKLIATKLGGDAASADGYMLQLAEIEAYGKPFCDKSLLETAMQAYLKADGTSDKDEVYVKASEGLSNPLLTNSQMKALIKAITVSSDSTGEGDNNNGNTTVVVAVCAVAAAAVVAGGTAIIVDKKKKGKLDK
ncbi:MAG: discoidin domain-containing protein [Firmicutes bacterium]|nr:discoidin domain-containing protein [Bacillota bacterium]